VAPWHYQRVQDRMSREEFDAKVRERIREWGGLLDADAAALLVLESLGIDVAEWTPIVKIEENAEVSVRGEVVAITPTRTFARQDGSSGRVANVTLMDASGTCRPCCGMTMSTLWRRDRFASERSSGVSIALSGGRISGSK